MKNVYLRKAEPTDMDLLFQWANDPVVRANSFHSEPIPYENHQKWFRQMMSNPTVLQFILMEENCPVGQIRLNLDGDEAEIGYSIAAEFRGKGYGHLILQLLKESVHDYYPQINRLLAKVKPGNTASNKLFEKEGYSMEYSLYTLNTK